MEERNLKAEMHRDFGNFQKNVGPIGRAKSGQIGHQSYKYAPLEVILDVVRKPLADNNLSFSQSVVEMVVVTTILHDNGEEIVAKASFPEWALADDGGRGSPMQRAGIIHTYMRRYALLSALGLSPSDEDTDAKGEGKAEKLSDEQKATIKLTKQLRECTTMEALVARWDGSQSILDGIKDKSTIGFDGVQKVFNTQKERLRPLPEDSVGYIHPDETKRSPQ